MIFGVRQVFESGDDGREDSEDFPKRQAGLKPVKCVEVDLDDLSADSETLCVYKSIFSTWEFYPTTCLVDVLHAVVPHSAFHMIPPFLSLIS